jgi:hypothetical protein
MRDKKVLICVLAVAVGVFGSIGWIVAEREWERRTGERDLAAAVAERDAADPNWRWDKLPAARPGLPPAQNGTELAKEVLADLPGDWAEGPEQKRVLKEVAALPPNAAPPEQTLEAVRRLVTKAGPSVAVARKFKDRPTGARDPAGFPKPPAADGADVRDTALTILQLDSLLADDRGDPDRVAANVLAALNVSRSIGADPFFQYQLLRVRLRGVATAQLERALATSHLGNSLDGLQAAWAADAEEPLLRYAIVGERAYYSDLTDRLVKGEPVLDEAKQAGAEESAARLASWRQRSAVPGDHATFLNWMGKAAEAARLPAEQQPAAFKALPPVEQSRDFALAHPRAAAVLAEAPKFWASTALMRCAATGIACERFRLARGRWPDSLAALCPDFLPSVPLDPFDGTPLKYTKRPDGVTVNAAGPSGEIAFRLWNPDARPKPAKTGTAP